MLPRGLCPCPPCYDGMTVPPLACLVLVQVAKFGKPTIVVKQAFPIYRGEVLPPSPKGPHSIHGIPGAARQQAPRRARGLNPVPTLVCLHVCLAYAAVGGLLLLHWCWGLLEQACNMLRINFVYVLDLQPKNVSSPRQDQPPTQISLRAHTAFASRQSVSQSGPRVLAGWLGPGWWCGGDRAAAWWYVVVWLHHAGTSSTRR